MTRLLDRLRASAVTPLRVGLLTDRDVGIGVFPQGGEILMVRDAAHELRQPLLTRFARQVARQGQR